MKSALLIFPHHLFADHPGLHKNPDTVILCEDTLFFGDEQYPCHFHTQKLLLHRAAMRHYFDQLKKRHTDVHYAEYANKASHLSTICEQLQNDGVSTIFVCDTVDFILEKRLKKQCTAHGIQLEYLTSPAFLNEKKDNQHYRSGKKRWFMADFYQWQRRRFDILMDGDQPIGGQWSFDEENRKKLPKKMIADIPPLKFPVENEYIIEARHYVETHMPEAIGEAQKFLYPITHDAAKKWLQDFLHLRFANFGPYEDAIVEDQNYLFHSILTPMLNIGLLEPRYIIDKTLSYAKQHAIPLASLEGFIRQIIGWREFMRATYEDLGVSMRTTNHWQHKRPMPAAFYDGSTGIIPIDNAIKRLLRTGYCHHIERLMLLGGFMFLCEIDPDHIYTWFMEMFIDSYDWVMVPNVYAMSQHADGGQITTKPYFSGSNYVRKMSHYQKGDWADIWDGLYWRWISKEADALRKNPRWAMMVRMADNMDENKMQIHQKNAAKFIEKLWPS